jgi:hypothetical protein
METGSLKKSYRHYKITESFPIEPFMTISGCETNLGSASAITYVSTPIGTLHGTYAATMDREETILEKACENYVLPQWFTSQTGKARHFPRLYELLGDFGITMTGFQEWINLNQQEEPDSEIWRGTFSPEYKRRVIFSQKLSIQTAALPRWKPQIIVDRHTVEGEDE